MTADLIEAHGGDMHAPQRLLENSLLEPASDNEPDLLSSTLGPRPNVAP
jgi:hypothetical protein